MKDSVMFCSIYSLIDVVSISSCWFYWWCPHVHWSTWLHSCQKVTELTSVVLCNLFTWFRATCSNVMYYHAISCNITSEYLHVYNRYAVAAGSHLSLLLGILFDHTWPLMFFLCYVEVEINIEVQNCYTKYITSPLPYKSLSWWHP